MLKDQVASDSRFDFFVTYIHTKMYIQRKTGELTIGMFTSLL